MNIKNLIYNIRDKQVMLDVDVAILYGYETMRINEAVKRNIKRFPENFCFKLTPLEYEELISQNAISKKTGNHGGNRKMPTVFTEQGIAMLSGLLKNDTAIEVSINIMNAFVQMRRFMSNNAHVFNRLTNAEYKLLDHDKKFNELFNLLQKDEEFKEKIFFDGQINDAYKVVSKLIKEAKDNITIIDNNLDKLIFDVLIKKRKGCNVLIITSKKNKITDFDIAKFNEKYPKLTIKHTDEYNDRFIIIDDEVVYHLGESLKDLGKKTFAINKMEDEKLTDKLFSDVYISH